jgi:UDP-3-O-[3-hydroxymyristoyl] glucosamine N-acyltransferase
MKNLGQYNIIDENVIIEEGASVGNFNIIQTGTIIRKGAVVGNYCEIGKNNDIGENSIVQGRVRTAGDCIIENNVTIKYGTILTSKVLLKEGCFLGPHTITLGSTHERVTKHGTIIGKNTYIGAGSKIAADIHIGDNIVVGALGFVNKDLTEVGIYAGLPVKKIK